MSNSSQREMPEESDKSPAELLIEREKTLSYGPVPHSLTDVPLRETAWQLIGNEFLLRGEGEHYFHYRKGRGVRIERGAGADPSEETLWLNGSVHAAIASMNGLLPLHASAIANNGRVYAFTGPSGAGKSTLIAALGERGLPMFCDDTLVLDLSEPERIVCLPGHKRLKLTPEAVAATGVAAQEQVALTVAKNYARSTAGDVRTALPLADLIFLEEGPEPEIAPIEGAERFERLQDDHYTARLFATARQFDTAARFQHLARLAGQVSMARFARPRALGSLWEGVDLVANYVKRGG